MKKILLTMVALMVAIVSFGQPVATKAQTDLKQLFSVSGLQKAVTERSYGIKSVVKGLQAPVAPVKMSKKKAPRRAEGEFSVDDLAGDWIQAMYCYEYDEESEELVEDMPTRYGNTVTIEPGNNNQITIYGLFSSDYGIVGTVNLEDFTITIPAGQVIGTTTSYGDIKMQNASTEGDFTATIYADGIVFEQLWYGSIVYQAQDARYTSFYSSVLFFPNATMQYKDSESTDVTALVAAIQDEGSATVSVFNFGDFGLCVDIDLQSDMTFSINAEQVVEYGGATYGSYSPYGISGKYLVDLVGKGTATTLTSDVDWTIYSDEGYWFGEQEPFTITLEDGSEFVYPEAETGELVTLPEGLTPVDYPFSYSVYEGNDPVAKEGTVKIAKDGNDIYFQGLDILLPEAWVKGLLDAEKGIVTIPVTYTGALNEVPHFLAAYGGANPKELILDYEDDSYSYSATTMIYKGTTGSAYVYFYNGLFIGTKPTPVTAPEGLQTVEMPFVGELFAGDAEEAEEVEGSVTVGITGNDVYIQNLFAEDVPDSWMKGSIQESEGTKFVVFPINQYIGDFSNALRAYLVGYYWPEGSEDGELSNVIFFYDDVNGYFEAITPVILTRSKNSTNYESFYRAGLLIGNIEANVKNVITQTKSANVWYTLSGNRIEKPAQKGIYIMNNKKVVVK
jgi:hypothetical protein